MMKVQPSTDRGRATVGRILDAACDLFATQGIRSTSLDDIGALAGVGRSQLYHFFVDKSDLVAEVVAVQVERVVGALTPTLEAFSTAADVYAWCDEVVAFHAASATSIRCPIGSLVHQLGDDDVAARRVLQSGFIRWEQLLEAALERVADSGHLTERSDARLLSSALLAAYQGGVLLASATGDVAPLRRALQGVADAALVDPAPRNHTKHTSKA
jgi:TetR/AcrR family transcriptional regulator, transcriptional repressor for nem operon